MLTIVVSLAKHLGFPEHLRLWQSHLFLMLLAPLSWKLEAQGSLLAEGWWIHLIKMTGPQPSSGAYLWWNHQGINSIINIWWMNEFPVIQVKMVLSSEVYMLNQQYYMCVGYKIYQALDSFLLPVVYGTRCHKDSWIQNFSRISHCRPWTNSPSWLRHSN